jgi:hypothetical protein
LIGAVTTPANVELGVKMTAPVVRFSTYVPSAVVSEVSDAHDDATVVLPAHRPIVEGSSG